MSAPETAGNPTLTSVALAVPACEKIIQPSDEKWTAQFVLAECELDL
jgi:hypothetical protein